MDPGLDAAGVYVAMTRGREINVLHVVATDLDDARQQFTEALARDRADRGLPVATAAAREAIAGLVPAGPVAVVNAERARLRELITRTTQQAAHANEVLAVIAEQAQRHRAEREQHQQVVAETDVLVAEVRDELVTPLIEHATADGTVFLTVREQMWQTNSARPGRFGKRAAERAGREATAAHDAVEQEVRDRWGDVPQTSHGLPAWAEAVATREADHDDRLVGARQQAVQAREALYELDQRHATERAALTRGVLGNARPGTLTGQVAQLKERAERARRDLDQLEALPPTEAAQIVRDRQAQAEAERAASKQERREAEARAASRPISPNAPAPTQSTGLGHDPHRGM